MVRSISERTLRVPPHKIKELTVSFFMVACTLTGFIAVRDNPPRYL